MYIRFITHDLHPDTGRETGLLSAAYRLMRSDRVHEYEEKAIHEHIVWLEEHLPEPDRFTRTRNAYHKNTHGLSWLKPTAQDALKHLRALAAILEEHGIPVTMVTTDKPGYLVYEDEWQIVAEPFGNE